MFDADFEFSEIFAHSPIFLKPWQKRRKGVQQIPRDILLHPLRHPLERPFAATLVDHLGGDSW